MKSIESIEELTGLIGSEIGVSDWLEITQARIQAFADATDDHQWIHLDVERARNESPWGAPVAHGYLTLSLIPCLNQQIMQVSGVKAVINYGLDKLRFPAPVISGARIRSRLSLLNVTAQDGGRYLARFSTVIEIEGADRPACVAENLAIYVV
ncbi:MaoC family dehydratase [Allohahella marinimesophila]